jgi:DNA-directed RNA polymerase specialized sigma24 family protein
MQLPHNLNINEIEVLAIINDVVDRLAPGFTFGYFDVDDVKQEGRIEAMKALPRYDSTKGASLKTFLYNHVKKRYINLKRDRYARPAPKNLTEDKLVSWHKRNGAKRSLIDTLDISDDRNQPSNFESDSFVDAIQHHELLRIIDIHLPVEYRGDYRCLLEDVKLPKTRRLKLLEILKEILNEHLTREEKGSPE